MPLDARMEFENYGVGPANQAAVAAAHAVVESSGPGAEAGAGTNQVPLVLYGGAGVGKTHLLHAIGNAVAGADPSRRVEYLTHDDFTARVREARDGAEETERFWESWGQVDVLLLDDIGAVAGEEDTQTELLRILEALHGTARRIVMSSDRAPGEIPGADERLVTRLESGLAVPIGPPDYDTRVAIVGAIARGRELALAPGVAEEIARVPVENAREVAALLNRIVDFQSAGGGAVQADEVLPLLDLRQEARGTGGDRRATPDDASLDFEGFLTDIASAVAEHVEAWKSEVADEVARWKDAGYRTGSLERLLDEPAAPPNYQAVLRGFGAAVRRLKALEAEAVEADATLAGHAVFHDPERLREGEAMVERARAAAVELPGPSVEFSRTGFQVGSTNETAVHAADAVAAEPAGRYNPLVIVGPAGVGKTHLLNAVGHGVSDATGGVSTVACVNAQQFADEYLAALREGTAKRWMARYRRVDAMCLDDLQVVAGKERTQDEVLHLIDDLVEAGKQVVCTADRALRDLPGLDERLRTRLESGLVVEMAPPDVALREQLYRRFLDGTPALDDLASYLATRPAEGIDNIIETVQRLTAAADAAGMPLTVAVARRTLEPGEPEPTSLPTPVRAAPAVRAASDVFFLDDEKVVWDWDDVASRVIEELR